MNTSKDPKKGHKKKKSFNPAEWHPQRRNDLEFDQLADQMSEEQAEFEELVESRHEEEEDDD